MSFTIAQALGTKQPFDAKKDFTHIITAAAAPHVLVINPSVPAKTVQELIAHVKANPGKLNCGSGGNGTNTHLGGELFKREAQVDLVHVPYKGAGAVLQDLMGGQVQALVTSLPTALPHIRSGKLRALVVTADKRSSLLPDVPSAKEAGRAWLPRGQEAPGRSGPRAESNTPVQAAQFVAAEMQQWGAVVKAAGVKAD